MDHDHETGKKYHEPVLVRETIENLVWRRSGRYLDCTLGDGGHSQAILRALDPEGELVGLDRDPDALQRAGERLKDGAGRVVLLQGEFGSLGEILASKGINRVEGVLMDLGVSSSHLDRPERGFSYRFDGPLDMRMNPGQGRTAADIVSQSPVADLERIFAEYGEIRQARKLSQFLYAWRKKTSLRTTADFREALGAAGFRSLPVLSQVFQALRMEVNDEPGQLSRGLEQGFSLLSAGGRFCVIAYHSGEDRVVKEFFREQARQGKARLVHKHVIKPEFEEIRRNPRSRSAKLRVVEKCA
jgi:16S rRNA (cytosine1402-N4)-methyltransferase